MGVLRVLRGGGEEVRPWDPGVPAEVESARRLFEDYRKRGLLACRTSAGQPGAALEAFDPGAEEIFMIEFVHGG